MTMKLPFTIHGSRFTIWKKSSRAIVAGRRACACGNRKSSIINRKSERGIALVITLILLSVTLVMAIAFLAISRRERGSVTTSTDTTTARLAADSALASAEAQIIANMLSTTNPYSFGLLVSTNYINVNGFDPANLNPLENVNYDFVAGGGALNPNQFEQNIANLYYLPRPPVFVQTNTDTTKPFDFRFYLDLNRNGKFDDTGSGVPNVDNFGNTNGTISEVGDPQWIGVLERPDTAHGPNNHFLSRYAFIALPVGNSLDLNAIHNQVFDEPPSPLPGTIISVNPNLAGLDGFSRNQGVGSWEINLAAFLADLNTNQWDLPAPEPYQYPGVVIGGSFAFDDARALLAYRYANNYNSLASVQNLFGANGQSAFQNDNIDGYSDGPLQTTMDTNADFVVADKSGLPWAGADSTNHFFDLTADLFNPTKTEINATLPGFIERLNQAGTNASTYDRYTFYRLLAQLGTDSLPESGKMNLNYSNAVAYMDANGITTNIVFIPNGETNFTPWTPVQFFTIAADQMLHLYTSNWFQADPSNFLATYYGIANFNYYYVNPDGYVLTNDPTGLGLTNVPYYGITNTIPSFGITISPGVTNPIPVYVNGQFVYSPAINRILQLAANIYDATTNNNTPVSGFDFPNVFRPIFNFVAENGITNVYVSGFSEVTSVNPFVESDAPLSRAFDLGNPVVLASFSPGIHAGNQAVNLSGVPMIIGAKKGFPNFNQFAMEDEFLITRKLQINRQTTNSLPKTYTVNEQFTSTVTNQLAIECWNSYASSYTRAVDIYATNFLTMTLTNDEGYSLNTTMIVWGVANIPANGWPGYDSSSTTSFQLPLNNTNMTFLPESAYVYNSGSPYFTTNLSVAWENTWPTLPQPHWWLIVTNNIQVAMVDHLTQRLVDYVQLRGPNSTRDITGDIWGNTGYTKYASMWLTNPIASSIPTNLPSGVWNQIQTEAQSDPNLNEQYGLCNFYSVNGIEYLPGVTSHKGLAFGSTNLNIQTETITAVIVKSTRLQANDPLVHYLANDLVDNDDSTNIQPTMDTTVIPTVGSKPSFLNNSYKPWGGNPNFNFPPGDTSQDFSNRCNTAIKDSMATSSDAWDFPTNKFPTVGWLGRVHRGTPWQTVYLKATDVAANNLANWEGWTKDTDNFDATNSAPKEDRLLFDLFTTAPNDNATRGQLSVNVDVNTSDPASGLAAWSAVFSGIVVPINYAGGYQVINPAGANGASSPLGQLVANINYTRTVFTNATSTGGAFKHGGDILAATSLTEQSPFLGSFASNPGGTNDEMYEWLPQQTMSLLRAGSAPRYVIYSYGQTLAPAPNGIVTGGGSFFGMVTNYQVVSEIATRAVVRVEDAKTPHPHIVVESYNILPPD